MREEETERGERSSKEGVCVKCVWCARKITRDGKVRAQWDMEEMPLKEAETSSSLLSPNHRGVCVKRWGKGRDRWEREGGGEGQGESPNVK